MDHRVMGVIGASGGLGVSTLAMALAVRAGPRAGATAAIDGAPDGGALDVTACLEHLPGLRWPDLAAAQGALDGAALLRALPSDGTTRVLAGTRRGGRDEVVAAAVTALATVCGVVVVDLGSSLWLADRCSDLVVVTGTSARQLADATALAEAIHDTGRAAALVVRTAGGDAVSPEEVAVHLDLPLAGTLRDDSRIRADADHGRVPGTRSTGALASLADDLLSTGSSATSSAQPVRA
jgi:MinD-like ATPase involved in chromosome partitioning or flagellar assembly